MINKNYIWPCLLNLMNLCFSRSISFDNNNVTAIKKVYIIGFFYLLFSISTVQAQSLGALIPDFRVNDDISTVMQQAPSIGVDGQGNFVIIWNDSRIYPGRVYCQIFDKDGNRIRNNFGIGHDTCGIGVITVLSDGKFIVMYANNKNLYQQRYDNFGYPLGSSGKINDTTTSEPIYPEDIGSDSLGNFIVVWTDYRYGALYPNAYGQRYNYLGNKLGGNFRINDNSPSIGGSSPRVAENKDGSFIVSLGRNGGMSGGGVYIQRYDMFGNNIGVNQKVDDNTTYVGIGYIDIASDGNGYFLVGWDDYRYNPTIAAIFYQMYDSLGNKIGVNQRADVNIGPDKGGTIVSMQSNGKFVIIWKDNRTGSFIGYCQRFNSNGTKIGINFPIPVNTSFTNSGMYAVKLFQDRIYTVWDDNRNGNQDYDIFSNVRSFINPDSILVSI
jgi:hypothetical protein